MNKFRMFMVIGIVALATMACGLFDIARNDDGTLTVETTLPLQVIQTTLENTADFSNIVDMQLELRDGYIFVSAASVEFQGITARDVSFHLELFALNGRLSAKITNVSVSENLFDDSVFEQVNELLAQRLAEASQENERSELVDVSVSPDGVKLTWRVDASLGN